MRVSEQMLFRSNLSQLQRQAVGALRAQDRVSSGKRVSLPSDDPVSAAQTLSFKKAVSQVDQYMRNIEEANRFLSVSEEVLREFEARLQRASELAVDMANSSKEPQDRKNAAQELKQIFNQLSDLANTTHEGQSLFAGNKIKTRPFDFEKEWKGRWVGEGLTVPLEITANDPSEPNDIGSDTLNITVDGVNATVMLEPGIYEGVDLANEIQTKINDHKDFITAGAQVSVSFVVDDPNIPEVGHLVIASDRIGSGSSVTLNPVVGFNIVEGENDILSVPIDGASTDVVLRAGTYPTGAALAAELQEQMGVPGDYSVQFDTDHFVITPLGGTPFVQALPSKLPLGDARTRLGLIKGTHQLSGEEYLGDDKEASVIIDRNVTLAKNLPGLRVFKGLVKKEVVNPDGVVEEKEVVVGTDIFADIISFQTALEINDVVGIQTAITDMNEALEQINGERAIIGARLNRLDETKIVQKELELATVSFQSEKEDIDLTQAISVLVQQQNALEAARAVAARILEQPTLLSFLR